MLTEGELYTFTLDIAKKMPLASPRSGGTKILEQRAVQPFADSARACLDGIGFEITMVGETTGVRCSVKQLAEKAQRSWSWEVRPDTVNRGHGRSFQRRTLNFSVVSYQNRERDDYTQEYPVVVRIVPLTAFERIMRAVTSTRGLLVELVAIAAALAALSKYRRRKPEADTAGSSG